VNGQGTDTWPHARRSRAHRLFLGRGQGAALVLHLCSFFVEHFLLNFIELEFVFISSLFGVIRYQSCSWSGKARAWEHGGKKGAVKARHHQNIFRVPLSSSVIGRMPK
jgi:hypothetical protein